MGFLRLREWQVIPQQVTNCMGKFMDNHTRRRALPAPRYDALLLRIIGAGDVFPCFPFAPSPRAYAFEVLVCVQIRGWLVADVKILQAGLGDSSCESVGNKREVANVILNDRYVLVFDTQFSTQRFLQRLNPLILRLRQEMVSGLDRLGAPFRFGRLVAG